MMLILERFRRARVDWQMRDQHVVWLLHHIHEGPRDVVGPLCGGLGAVEEGRVGQTRMQAGDASACIAQFRAKIVGVASNEPLGR